MPVSGRIGLARTEDGLAGTVAGARARNSNRRPACGQGRAGPRSTSRKCGGSRWGRSPSRVRRRRWAITSSCLGPAGLGQEPCFAERPPGPSSRPLDEASAPGELIGSIPGLPLPLPAGGRSGRPPFSSASRDLSPRRSSAGARRGCVRARFSLATNGVLFLDELAEFPSPLLDLLRQPARGGSPSESLERGRQSPPGQVSS